jgi:hypothetical protein
MHQRNLWIRKNGWEMVEEPSAEGDDQAQLLALFDYNG